MSGERSDASIVVKNVVKTFGSSVTALDNISFDVKKGEFFSVIGPSGSGKTTLLKCIVGLEKPDSGSIYIEGKDALNIPVYKRGIALVFQNFGLFSNKTVFENIAFGLKVRKIPKDEIKEQVKAIMSLTGLEGLENSNPTALSIGQMQRVALARSIVIKPNLILFDEPLGNIDPSLQRKMILEIKQIHRKVGLTSVYVTHDQEQAMRLADRVMVMNLGIIEQLGTPLEVYANPTSIFVAKFVGEINMLKGETKELKEDSVILETDVGLLEAKMGERKISPGEKLVYAIRPERISIDSSAKDCANRAEAEVLESVYSGSSIKYKVKLTNEIIFKIFTDGGLGKKKKEIKEKILIGWDSEDAIMLDKPSLHPKVDIDRAILGA